MRATREGFDDHLLAALSDAALEQASSAAVLRRGQMYVASGAIEALMEERGARPSIRAQVQGSARYTTALSITDGELTGECDCPNAQEGWFCKHQVALAIVWRNRLQGLDTPVDETARKTVAASAKRARTLEANRTALREFLYGQPASALADKLLEWTERNAGIERELQLWRKVAKAPPPVEVKPLISQILAPGNQFLTWRDTADYVRRAQAVLPLLAQLRAQDPQAGAAAALHALQRGWAVLGQADDSDGEVGGLCQAIGSQWVAALQAAGPQLARFADTYLKVRLAEPLDSFDAAAVEAAIGEAAMTRYRQLLAERWRRAREAVAAARAGQAKAAGRSAAQRAALRYLSGDDIELVRLEHLHLEQLEAAGDIDGALEVLRSDLSEPHRFSRVTRFLEAHGRLREAFASAEQACKADPDDWRLQEDLLRCYERDGWSEEAFALRRRQFEQAPGVERWQLVLAAGVAAGHDVETLRDELLQWLAAREEGSRRRARAAGPDVTLRVEILCREEHLAEALALVQPPARCAPTVLRSLALRLPSTQADEAVALLLRVLTAAMPQATSPYREALALVAEIAERMPAPRRAAWLAQLRSDYRAKRNFVRGLPRG